MFVIIMNFRDKRIVESDEEEEFVDEEVSSEELPPLGINTSEEVKVDEKLK